MIFTNLTKVDTYDVTVTGLATDSVVAITKDYIDDTHTIAWQGCVVDSDNGQIIAHNMPAGQYRVRVIHMNYHVIELDFRHSGLTTLNIPLTLEYNYQKP